MSKAVCLLIITLSHFFPLDADVYSLPRLLSFLAAFFIHSLSFLGLFLTPEGERRLRLLVFLTPKGERRLRLLVELVPTMIACRKYYKEKKAGQNYRSVSIKIIDLGRL